MAQVNNLTFDITQIQAQPYRDLPIQYTTTTVHAISPIEIILVAAGFIFLSYWLIRVRKNKEQYTNWTNPNGRVVNLYKIVNITFYAFIGVVILGGILQILLSRGG